MQKLIPGNTYVVKFNGQTAHIPIYLNDDPRDTRTIQNLVTGDTIFLLDNTNSFKKFIINGRIGYADVFDNECELICTQDKKI